MGYGTYIQGDVFFKVQFDRPGGASAAKAEAAGNPENVGVYRNDRFVVKY